MSAPKHPATYSAELIPVLRGELERLPQKLTGLPILDPFAGIGGIWEVAQGLGRTVHGLEIEPEWARQAPEGLVMTVADARERALAWLADPYPMFAAVCSSPCLEQSEVILTADARWVPAGDLTVGDRLLAFDESNPGVKANGHAFRRRYQMATVVRSIPRDVSTMRVHLADGSSVVTTPAHPWLAARSAGYSNHEWMTTAELAVRLAVLQPVVLRQFTPWATEGGFRAGYLSGMFDGEGSFTFGVHGAPKLSLCQVDGPVLDRTKQYLDDLGIGWNEIVRSKVEGRRQVHNLYVTGGWPGAVSALGRLRPARLLPKLEDGKVATRSVQPERVAVVAVEDAGVRTIQEIETSTGTYFGAGFLHHNCYGNRMADSHEARDDSRRITYRHTLGRPLSDGNSGGMQWGPAYRALHRDVWGGCVAALAPGGRLILNVADHIRGGERVHVSDWHRWTMEDLGLKHVRTHRVETPGMRFGQNGQTRVGFEEVQVWRKQR